MGDRGLGRTDKETLKKELTLTGSAMIALISSVHEKKGSFRFRAGGNSMKPLIRNGDIITVSPIGDIPPGPGEVAAYRYDDGGELIVHRIISVNSGRYCIRGDNSNYKHCDVSGNDIIGIVTRLERKGKRVFIPGRYHSSRFNRIFLRFTLLRIRMIRGFKKVSKKLSPDSSREPR